MQNSRLPFVLLFLGLVVLSYQFLAHPTASEQDFSKRIRIGLGDLAEDALDSTFRPSTHKHTQVSPYQIVGLAPVTLQPAPEVSSSPIPTTAAPVDLKTLAKATDEKAKADAKKKKKKKKTVSPNPDANAQNAVPVAPATIVPIATDVPPAPVAPPAADQAATSGLTNISNVSAKNQAMIQYYENLLLKTPDSVATQKFVAAHKANQITDDVYFTIAAAMMADSRLQMKDLAVYVYGQDVSIQSFVALVTILDTDNANDVVKTDCLKYLNSYSDVTNSIGIAVLGTALTTAVTTSSLHIEALKLIDTAAKQFSQLEMTQTTGAAGQINVSTYNPGGAQKLFVPFISLLNNVIHTSTDSSTKSIASQDLTDLQGLLGNESASINP